MRKLKTIGFIAAVSLTALTTTPNAEAGGFIYPVDDGSFIVDGAPGNWDDNGGDTCAAPSAWDLVWALIFLEGSTV